MAKKISKSRVATKSATGKGTAGVPALFDAELAEAAKRSLARMRVPTQGSRVSLKGKLFSVGGSTIGPEIKVSVVDFGYAHAYYPGVYNEKNPQPPVCFSLALDPTALAPHALAPEKQSVSCDTCPKNQFGSATTGTGRGKACKDIVRIAIMHEDDLENEETVAEGKIATLDLPAMSVKNWTEYSNAVVRKTGRELLAFVTRLKFDPKQSYPVVEFELDSAISEVSVVSALSRRQLEADEMILSPWQPVSEEKRKEAAPTGRQSTARSTGTSRSRFKS